MSAKKLHIVHTESAIGWGGKEIRVLTEAKGMEQRGHQVTLICDPNSAIYTEAQRLNLTTVPLPIEKKTIKGLKAIRHWLKQQRDVNIINTHSSADSWMTVLACQTLFNAPPIVRTRHVSSPISNNVMSHWLYKKASKHLAITGEAVRQMLHQQSQIPLAQMTSVPTGIDLDYYKPALTNPAIRDQLDITEDTPLIGILAALRSWKGQRTLMEALSIVHKTHPAAHLVLIGDGPIKPGLIEFAQQHNVSKQVHFVGHQTNTAEWLNALDIFALPSYANEGVPQGLMQAMACQKACISTPIGGIPDVLHHQQTGLLVQPKDPAALANAIIELLEQPDLRQQLAQNAYHYAQQHFSLDTMLDKMEHIFYQFAR